MYRANYPKSVEECLIPNKKYKGRTLKAMKEFRCSKPWKGTPEERQTKFLRLNDMLAIAYNITPPEIKFNGGDYYSPVLHLISLSAKCSVVTYLHEFGHALGKDERRTCRWSINLFRRIFPNSYSRCIHEGHMLLKRKISVLPNIYDNVSFLTVHHIDGNPSNNDPSNLQLVPINQNGR